MTQVLEADMTTSDPPVSPRSVAAGVLVGTFWVASVLALGIGWWYAAMAAKNAPGTVPVQIGLQAPPLTSSGDLWPCVDGQDVLGYGCGESVSSDQWPVDVPLPAWSDGALVANVGLGPWWTPIATSVGTWGVWVAVGVVGLLHVPVLRQIATGRGQVRTDRRLAITAGVVFLTWVAATVGPYLAAGAEIRSMEQNVLFQVTADPATAYVLPQGWLEPDLRVTWWPGAVVVLLVVLALAVRHGRRLAAQTEGLV